MILTLKNKKVNNIKHGYYKHLFDTIEQIGSIPEQVKWLIQEKLKRKKVKKNTIIQAKNSEVLHLYFIHSGFVRGYYDFNDHQVTTWLNGPGNFILSISNFFGKIPAKQSVQTITDCKLIYIEIKDFFEIIYSDFQSFKVYQKMLEYYYFAAEERVFLSKIPNSKERYQYFKKSMFYPNLSNLSDKYIADLLGIRPETLSRLKKNDLNQ